MECMICDKHKDFQRVTGNPILQRDGLVVAHFPVIESVPATRGHLIIEPLRHLVNPTELSDNEAAALGLLIRDGIGLLTAKLGAEHVYVVRINDKVAHFHTHLVPRFAGTPKDFWGPKIMDWAGATKIGLAEVQQLSELLRKAM